MPYMNDKGNIILADFENDDNPLFPVRITGLVSGTPITITIVAIQHPEFSFDSYAHIQVEDYLDEVLGATDGEDAVYTFQIENPGDELWISPWGETNTVEINISYPSSGECEIRYDYESIVPIAISSELSDTGEERIHIAPSMEHVEPEPTPPAPDAYVLLDNNCTMDFILRPLIWYDYIDPDHGPQEEIDPPSWYVPGDNFTVTWQDWEGEYEYDSNDGVFYLVADNGGTPPTCCGPEGQTDPLPTFIQGSNSAHGYITWLCG